MEQKDEFESRKKLYGDKEEPAMTLSEDQKISFDESVEFMINKEQFFSVIGPAGSGKTTLMKAITKEAKQRQWNVALAAPTHKAAKQLSLSCDMPAQTIHRILGLAMKEDPRTGELVLQTTGKNMLTTNMFLICDEGSMVGNELLEILKESVKYIDIKVLFVGDIAQLNPVNEEPSSVVDAKTCEWNITALTKIHRQAAENPIIRLATAIREADPMDLPMPENDVFNDSGIIILDGPEFRLKCVQSCSDNPENRYIGYQNEVVDNAAKQIRRQTYGEDAKLHPYLAGESLVVNERYVYKYLLFEKDDDQEFANIYIDNNTEFLVDRVYMDDDLYRVIGEVDDIQVEFQAMRNYKSRKRYLEITAKKCAAKAKDALEKQPWGPYWEAVKYIADLRSASSLTIHKSQGSTFNDAFLNFDQIRVCARVGETDEQTLAYAKEAQRLYYVAVTRASRMLYVTGV